ncbi:MAG: FHA domain-containing protein, partial [Planctomycetaceae bacterium]|nr:FHA domain-containing protein [Planctomycetaceae bacterium]
MDGNSRIWALHGRLVADGVQCRVDIETLPFQIGRRADLSLTLRSGAISSLHAEITERDGQLWIRDHSSKNGTFVNGVRIKHEVTLAENDLVQIADMPFRLTRERMTTHNSTLAADHDQGALALVQLNALLHTREITPVYQPIVDLSNGSIVAFEALARSRLLGLETPAAIF